MAEATQNQPVQNTNPNMAISFTDDFKAVAMWTLVGIIIGAGATYYFLNKPPEDEE